MKEAIRIEAISFLICIGSCRVGEGYHSSVLGKSKSAKQVMRDFGRFGLLIVCRVAGKISFYPTKVAVNLVASNEKSRQSDILGKSVTATRSLEEGLYLYAISLASLFCVVTLLVLLATRDLACHLTRSCLTYLSRFSALDAPVPSRSHLAIIVQTNFQVAAYTRSKLHISTLGLFCDITSYRRLPNVIFFKITRDSIRSAFRLGVTAEQILRFLLIHAHPMLRSGGHQLVPTNVRDQILLWDRERWRVVIDEVWVHQCRDVAEFAAICQYASDSDALAWGAAHTNKLFIHWSKHSRIQNHIRKYRQTITA